MSVPDEYSIFCTKCDCYNVSDIVCGDCVEEIKKKAHQAGIDEAVEVLVKRVMELQREWKSQEEEHGLANQGTIDRWAEAKLNRDTIEALQDNK